MIVMKFGGTSIEDIDSIRRVVEIIHSRLDLQPVVVNSAMGKTTRNLLHMARIAAGGMDQEAAGELESLRAYHIALARGLTPDFEESGIQRDLERYFEELRALLEGLCTLGELTPRSQDRILSYGELVATTIVASALRQRGIDARWLDARDFIITDDRFTGARPVDDLTSGGIRREVLPVVSSGQIPVIQGFIGSTRNGATTTLGFEGSDLTASLVGAALDVADIQIWKDVDGIMTADPSIFAEARTIEEISFTEASELTFFGAKVLHPDTLEPARRKGIPVHIYNSRQPGRGGTVITAHAKSERAVITSITYKRPVCTVGIVPDVSADPAGFLRALFEILDRERISPSIMTTSKAGMVMAFSDSQIAEELIDELSRLGAVHVSRGKGTISLVGENIRGVPDFTSLVLHNLGGIAIDMIAHGASSISFTFVVNEADIPSVVARLHKTFFDAPDAHMD
ncbi:MAG: aspartate kinase [Deltaproteobacteria bacterium]|nr:aspartate kinase [Deltaproteobacteria bacterium]